MSEPKPSEIELSVVIPVYNEAENMAPLLARLTEALASLDYEVIFVDDGSTDQTIGMMEATVDGPDRAKLAHVPLARQVASVTSG